LRAFAQTVARQDHKDEHAQEDEREPEDEQQPLGIPQSTDEHHAQKGDEKHVEQDERSVTASRGARYCFGARSPQHLISIDRCSWFGSFFMIFCLYS